VYVFDGKPPDLKSQTLASRAEGKQQADADLAAALEGGNAEDIRKAAHRTARATPQMNADVQELLRLLGCPVILAPSEAEASCAALARDGKVYATATEDMDALTFGTSIMLKNFFDTESSRNPGTKKPVFEVSLETLLAQLDVDMDVFIDFCIMCGCDYCGTIRGIGPSTAFKLLKTHGSIEKVVATLDQAKIPPPDEWRIQEARQLFKSPEVVDTSAVQLTWGTPNYEGLWVFLVTKHSFNEARVAKVVERLKACRHSGQQTRLDAFFKIKQTKEVKDKDKFDPFKKKAGASSSKAGGSSKVSGKRPATGGGRNAKALKK